jgi:hypothetical protein
MKTGTFVLSVGGAIIVVLTLIQILTGINITPGVALAGIAILFSGALFWEKLAALVSRTAPQQIEVHIQRQKKDWI